MKELKVVYALIQNEDGQVLLVHNTDVEVGHCLEVKLSRKKR